MINHDDTDVVGASQAAHGIEAGNLYGRSSQELRELPHLLEEKYFSISSSWQRILGLEVPKPPIVIVRDIILNFFRICID